MIFKKVVLFRIRALLLFVFIINFTPLACFLKACNQLSVHMCTMHTIMGIMQSQQLSMTTTLCIIFILGLK